MKLTKFESGAVVGAPANPTGSVGYPTDRVPGVTPPTIPGAYWFYQVLMELHNVITGAGAALTPDETVLNQLYTAILKLIASKGVDSWPTGGVANTSGIKFGNGTILQWATTGTVVPGGTVCVFPNDFPTAGKFVIGIANNGYIAIDQSTVTAHQFTAVHDSGGSGPLTYIAVGY